MDVGLVVGVTALGIVHGILPDHGWPIAAVYALDRPQKWLRGTVAALVLGVGHLLSSVALVVAYYWFSSFAAFAEGPWMKPLAGGLLILLGIYEYLGDGHLHDHGPVVAHDHDDVHEDGDAHGHHHTAERDTRHDASHTPGAGAEGVGLFDWIRARIPNLGHTHFSDSHADDGLRTLGVTALLLGFAHEEPIQILAICAGTEFCLELMLVYSLAVIVAILFPTLLLIAGYQTHRERIERYTPYLPTLTAVVLVAVGSSFVLGIF